MQKPSALLAAVGEASSGTRDRSAPRKWRLIHIAASVSVLGADLALLVLGTAGLTGLNARFVYAAAHLLASRLLVPLAVLSLATGVAIAVRAGMFKQRWVVAKFAITAVMTIAATLVLVPGLQTAATAASSGEMLGRGSAIKLALIPAVASALLLLNVRLAIYKPTRHVRSR